MLMTAAPATALDKAYPGFWAPEKEACDPGDRTAFMITPKGFSGPENVCETKEERREHGGWRLRFYCAQEGYEFWLIVHWHLQRDGRLRETMKGHPRECVRCG